MGKIKEILKKNERFMNVYRKGLNDIIRFMSLHCPVLLSRIQYRQRMGRRLNLKHPVYLNEKLMWLKFYKYTDNPDVTRCIDKYQVRDYVKECGLGHLLNDLYGVWENARDIEWDLLPERFAIKCNHGCGFNLICREKRTFDIPAATEKLNEWMYKESWTEHAETNYRGIHKKIICEKFLEGGG